MTKEEIKRFYKEDIEAKKLKRALFRLSERDYQILLDRASKEGIPVSTWLRMMVVYGRL